MGLFGEEDDETDEDEDEDEETQAARRLLAEEIRDLEAAIEKKIAEIGTVQNVLIKVCTLVNRDRTVSWSLMDERVFFRSADLRTRFINCGPILIVVYCKGNK